MASATLNGEIRLVAEDPNGNQTCVYKFRSNSAINAGGSPDGVLANTTHDKQVKVGAAGPTMTGGWKARLLFKLDAADGLDASDCVIQIPLTLDNGSQLTLAASDFGFTTDLPASSPAGSWIELGTGYEIANNLRAKFGSFDKTVPTVIAIENDAA